MLALTLSVASACAHAPGSWGDPDRDARARDGRGDASAMCAVRVESEYDVTIEAGARAGSEQLSLGTLEPDDAIDIGVPCSYRAVTVYRLVRNGAGAEVQLRPVARALDPVGTTTFTLRPTDTRIPTASRR